MTARKKAGAGKPRTPAPELALRVRVVARELPGASFCDPCSPGAAREESVFVGVQRGQEVIDEVRADARQAVFDLEFRVGEKKDGSPNFLGPFAQGPVDDRFFYISWGLGARAGRTRMFRRLKIRLGHLPWAPIRRAIRAGKPIEVTLRLTDARGAPLCGSAEPPFVAWETG
ncbi:MAG TPA: DUF5990 family protein [Planctomycetota bacterium]|nr:DUF5990 family protein [Planctomycetota bacterium]